MNKKYLLKALFLIILSAFLYTGCSSNDEDYKAPSEGTGASSNMLTVYCLGCHEGTYDKFAASTVALGEDNWLNPHRSAHGTGFACLTCHEHNVNGERATNCLASPDMAVVMIGDTCSSYCHDQYTISNPYPDYR